MVDTLTITDLELWTHIGVPEEERQREQRVLVTLQLEVAGCKATETDNLQDTVSYEEVVRKIRALAKGERKTLEKFAEDMARSVLTDKRIERVTVALRKFTLPGTKEVSLTVTKP